MSDRTWPFADEQRSIRFQDFVTDVHEVRNLGSAMVRVGNKMTRSAAIMQAVANSEDGQQGQAVESLRESVGESWVMLGQAGELYTPVGQAVVDYADEIAEIKPALNTAKADAYERWTAYLALPGDKDGRSYGPFGVTKPDEGSAELEQDESEDRAKNAAYEEWVDAAKVYETAHGSWEDAWGTAVSKIGEKFTDDLKDGCWEALEEIGDFLSTAALVIGILAIIIGGPILAAIALAVGVLALIVVGIQYLGGKKTLLDVGLAVLAILPFGKLAGMTKLLHFNKLAFKSFAKGGIGNFGKLKGLFSKPTLGKDGLISIFRQKGASAAFSKFLTGNTGFKGVYRNHKSFWQGAGPEIAQIRNTSAVRNLAAADWAFTAAGTMLGHYGRVASAFGLPDRPQPLKVMF